MSKYYPTKKYIKKLSTWAVYKKDTCDFIGTFDEIMEHYGWRIERLYYYTSKSYEKKLLKMKHRDTNIQLVLLDKVKGKPNDLKKYRKKRKKVNKEVKNPFAKYRVRNAKAAKYIQDNLITLTECKQSKNKQELLDVTIEDLQIILEFLKGKKHEE